MSDVRIIDKMPQFKRSLYSVMGDALKEATRDTVINSKAKAPYSGKGHLRADVGIRRTSRLSYTVYYGDNNAKDYARFQEFGGDGTRKVRKYTTPGTGAHFLRDAGNEQARKIDRTFKKHAMRAKA